MHERLADAVLEGRGAPALLAILGDHVGCSLALVDASGRVVGERHGNRLDACEDVLELPVGADGEIATLRAGKPARRAVRVRPARAPPRADRARVRALAPPRGLGGGAPARRRPARGPRARPPRRARDRAPDLGVRARPARPLRRAARGRAQARHGRRTSAPPPPGCSTRAARATCLPRAATGQPSSSRPAIEEDALAIARELVDASPGTRVGVGRPSSGTGLGRSLLEARAALDAVAGPVASYHDLGSLELLLSLPGATLEAFVARVLGPAVDELLAARVAHGAARQRLPLERGLRPPRRPSPHAPLPDGAAAQADRPPPGRSGAADGALAGCEGETGACGARSRACDDLRQRRRCVVYRTDTAPDLCHDTGVPKTVVIADDHPSFRASARAILEAEGFEVIGEAEDGASAIAAARDLAPDVLLLDVQLPDLDGFAVCRECGRNGGPPAVVLVSSRDACDYGGLIEQSGARGFIAKAELQRRRAGRSAGLSARVFSLAAAAAVAARARDDRGPARARERPRGQQGGDDRVSPSRRASPSSRAASSRCGAGRTTAPATCSRPSATSGSSARSPSRTTTGCSRSALALNSLVFGAFIHLLLAFPGGRLTSRRDLWLVVSTYALVLTGSVATLLLEEVPDPTSCPGCRSTIAVGSSDGLESVLTVDRDGARASRSWPRSSSSSSAATCARGGRCGARSARSSAPARSRCWCSRSRWSSTPTREGAAQPLEYVFLAAFAMVPLAFLARRPAQPAGPVRRRRPPARARPGNADPRRARRRARRPDARDRVLAAGAGVLRHRGRKAAARRAGGTGRDARRARGPADRRAAARPAARRRAGARRRGRRAAGLWLDNERLQAKLRAQVEFLEAIVNASPSLLCSLDREGRIANLNDAAWQASGYVEENDVKGQTVLGRLRRRGGASRVAPPVRGGGARARGGRASSTRSSTRSASD